MRLALWLVVFVIAFALFTIPISTEKKEFEKTTVQQREEVKVLHETNTELERRVEYLENTLKEARVIHATVTAYSPTENQTDSDPLITASMQPVREGTVAVSRDLFYGGWVFGREVYIEGYGIFVITDLMHERKKQQIDIFRFSTKKAMKFGRKTLRVALLN